MLQKLKDFAKTPNLPFGIGTAIIRLTSDAHLAAIFNAFGLEDLCEIQGNPTPPPTPIPTTTPSPTTSPYNTTVTTTTPAYNVTAAAYSNATTTTGTTIPANSTIPTNSTMPTNSTITPTPTPTADTCQKYYNAVFNKASLGIFATQQIINALGNIKLGIEKKDGMYFATATSSVLLGAGGILHAVDKRIPATILFTTAFGINLAINAAQIFAPGKSLVQKKDYMVKAFLHAVQFTATVAGLPDFVSISKDASTWMLNAGALATLAHGFYNFLMIDVPDLQKQYRDQDYENLDDDDDKASKKWGFGLFGGGPPKEVDLANVQVATGGTSTDFFAGEVDGDSKASNKSSSSEEDEDADETTRLLT